MDINPYAKKKDNNSPDFSLSGIIVGTKEPNYKKKNNLPIENKSEININGPKLDFNGNIIRKESTNGTWFLAVEDFKIYNGMIFKGNFNLFYCNITKE